MVDDLRNQLQNKVEELEKLSQRVAFLTEENEALAGVVKMEGKQFCANACMRDAYDALLNSFLSLFPQSESENKWQFCDKKTRASTPAFRLLISLCHEDLVQSIKGMNLILKSPDDMVEKTHALGLHQKLCCFMRTLQCKNAAFFCDMLEAQMKQSELTRHKIKYEAKELAHARQAFAYDLMKALD